MASHLTASQPAMQSIALTRSEPCFDCVPIGNKQLLPHELPTTSRAVEYRKLKTSPINLLMRLPCHLNDGYLESGFNVLFIGS